MEELAEIAGIPKDPVKMPVYAGEVGRPADCSRHRARLAMMAMSRKMPVQGSGEIEMLLPWHAAGTLNARDVHLVEAALGHHPGLARLYAAIREECAEILHLNESLGAPSARAMAKLFAAIDAEPAATPSRFRFKNAGQGG
jgi:hypothetical protein